LVFDFTTVGSPLIALTRGFEDEADAHAESKMTAKRPADFKRS